MVLRVGEEGGATPVTHSRTCPPYKLAKGGQSAVPASLPRGGGGPPSPLGEGSGCGSAGGKNKTATCAIPSATTAQTDEHALHLPTYIDLSRVKVLNV